MAAASGWGGPGGAGRARARACGADAGPRPSPAWQSGVLEQRQQRLGRGARAAQVGHLPQEAARGGQGQGLARAVVGHDAPAVERRGDGAGERPVGRHQGAGPALLHGARIRSAIASASARGEGASRGSRPRRPGPRAPRSGPSEATGPSRGGRAQGQGDEPAAQLAGRGREVQGRDLGGLEPRRRRRPRGGLRCPRPVSASSRRSQMGRGRSGRSPAAPRALGQARHGLQQSERWRRARGGAGHDDRAVGRRSARAGRAAPRRGAFGASPSGRPSASNQGSRMRRNVSSAPSGPTGPRRRGAAMAEGARLALHLLHQVGEAVGQVEEPAAGGEVRARARGGPRRVATAPACGAGRGRAGGGRRPRGRAPRPRRGAGGAPCGRGPASNTSRRRRCIRRVGT
jgi:hypothetical protein